MLRQVEVSGRGGAGQGEVTTELSCGQCPDGATVPALGSLSRLRMTPLRCAAMVYRRDSLHTVLICLRRRYTQGRTQGEGPGARPPWDLKNTIFSGFLPLNYVIYIFEVCFLCFLLCGRTEEACSMVNSLRKVDFSHPTSHYT